MIRTFVLPGAQTIGLVSGSGASPRPPSFGLSCGGACAGAELVEGACREPVEGSAAGSLLAVMATVTGTMSLS